MVALDDCIKIGRTRNITNRIQAYKQTNTNVEILFASPVSTFDALTSYGETEEPRTQKRP